MSREGFWTERTTAWYRRAIARSDYGERVLAALAAILRGCRDALDVGAGCGALALPLARRLQHVTALEPSPSMAAALRDAAGEAGLGNVRVIEAPWGAPVEAHDLVLCAHVGGLICEGSPFLAEVGKVARRAGAIVQDLDNDDKFFFRQLYPVLLGRPYRTRCHEADVLGELRRRGLDPTVVAIEYSSDQPFRDLDEACEFWMTYLGLEGSEPRAYLQRFLAERLVPGGGELIAPYRKRAAVITWETQER